MTSQVLSTAIIIAEAHGEGKGFRGGKAKRPPSTVPVPVASPGRRSPGRPSGERRRRRPPDGGWGAGTLPRPTSSSLPSLLAFARYRMAPSPPRACRTFPELFLARNPAVLYNRALPRRDAVARALRTAWRGSGVDPGDRSLTTPRGVRRPGESLEAPATFDGPAKDLGGGRFSRSRILVALSRVTLAVPRLGVRRSGAPVPRGRGDLWTDVPEESPMALEMGASWRLA